MATYRKRGRSWRVEVARQGVRLSATFDTKIEAQGWAARTESEILIGKRTSEGVHHQTVAAAFKRYADTISPTHQGERWERIRLNAFARSMGQLIDLPIAEVTPEHIADWRDRRLKEVSASSVLRELSLLSAVFTVARQEWRWLTENPCRDVKRPSAPAHRDRRISADEIQAILEALGFQEDQPCQTLSWEIAVAFLFAIETAMRAGEILSLTLDTVQLNQRVARLKRTKNGDKRDVPLSHRAVDLLKKLPMSEHGSYFRVSSASLDTLFRKATRRAKIDNLHFHDTRHEAITRLARKLDVLDLARMVGHRNPKMLMVYYNATACEIAQRLD